MREKKKKVERENVEFRQRGYRNFSAQFYCPGVRGVRGVPKVKRKKKFDKLIVAMPLPKQGKKIVTIVAMTLPKMGEKKKVVPKSGESKKKKSVTFTIFSQ